MDIQERHMYQDEELREALLAINDGDKVEVWLWVDEALVHITGIVKNNAVGLVSLDDPDICAVSVQWRKEDEWTNSSVAILVNKVTRHAVIYYRLDGLDYDGASMWSRTLAEVAGKTPAPPVKKRSGELLRENYTIIIPNEEDAALLRGGL